jgi:type IV pilus assembly protein PilA
MVRLKGKYNIMSSRAFLGVREDRMAQGLAERWLGAAKGFTLIELLVVIAIVGILAGISIPQYANYRKRAMVADIKSNLKNAATAQEAYFVDRQTYSLALGDLVSYGFKQGANVGLGMSSSSTTFVITATHTGCDVGAAFTFQGYGVIQEPPGGC